MGSTRRGRRPGGRGGRPRWTLHSRLEPGRCGIHGACCAHVPCAAPDAGAQRGGRPHAVALCSRYRRKPDEPPFGTRSHPGADRVPDRSRRGRWEFRALMRWCRRSRIASGRLSGCCCTTCVSSGRFALGTDHRRSHGRNTGAGFRPRDLPMTCHCATVSSNSHLGEALPGGHAERDRVPSAASRRPRSPPLQSTIPAGQLGFAR